MLVIRDAQIKAIESSMVDRFERRMLDHAEASFSKQFGFLGRTGMLAVVRLSVSRAARYGFEGDRHIFLYLALMLMLGSYFDEDPQLPWVQENVRNIDGLYAAAMSYLDKVAGEENEYLVRALIRLRDFEPQSVESFAGIPAVLKRLYPEKAAIHGSASIRATAEQAVAAARRHGLIAPEHACLFALLAFLLGSGFERDPQFPWVQESLTMHQAKKAGQLLERARAYVAFGLS